MGDTMIDIMELIDWDNVMKQPRYAGGHEEIMENLFTSPVKVIARWIEDEYQGELCFVYLLPDESVAIITDYFGSCSGCDAWEEATDEDAKSMITSMVSSARRLKNIDETLSWLSRDESAWAEDYSHRAATHTLPQVARYKYNGLEQDND